MPSQKIEFSGNKGVRLSARLDSPETPPRAYAVFAHCFACTKDSRAAAYVARGLTQQDIAVLRFDFTGIGESDGALPDSDFSSNVEDLVAAASYLRTNHRGPEILIGHSLGGAAVIAAASRIPEVVAVATIGAPFSPDHVKGAFAEAMDRIEADGFAIVKLAGRSIRVEKRFLEDLASQRQSERLKELHRALLVLHSPEDAIVDIGHARRIFEAAGFPKAFVSLDGMDHLLPREDDATYASGIIAAWAGRHIAAPSSVRANLVHRE